MVNAFKLESVSLSTTYFMPFGFHKVLYFQTPKFQKKKKKNFEIAFDRREREDERDERAYNI